MWWKEAAGAWSDKPVQGWGAGSFAVTHKLYRDVELPVVQPHNMPLQFLAETGIVGTLLVTGALGFLLFCAFERVRAMAAGRERDIAVALFAGAVGVARARARRLGLGHPRRDGAGADLPRRARRHAVARRAASRTSTAAPARAARCSRSPASPPACSIVSAGLPMLADQKASDAQAVSANAGAAELEDAAAEAELAARLDPTAVRPLLAAVGDRAGPRPAARRARATCSTPSTASPTARSPGSACSSWR